MQIRILLILSAVLLPLLANAQESEQTPLSVLNKRMKAMADHNLPAFMSTYADNVEILHFWKRSSPTDP
jgi:hypothetical protein